MQMEKLDFKLSEIFNEKSVPPNEWEIFFLNKLKEICRAVDIHAEVITDLLDRLRSLQADCFLGKDPNPEGIFTDSYKPTRFEKFKKEIETCTNDSPEEDIEQILYDKSRDLKWGSTAQTSVAQEKTTGLNFWEIWQHYKEGKKIKRKKWDHSIILLLPLNLECEIKIEDIEATDWEVV